jgi:RND family efflux transporter MFP subunit
MRFRPAFWLAVLGLAACGDSDHDHAHPAAPEAKTAQVTAWSDRFEVFIDHPRAVVGTPTAFATHVTDLRTLEPRAKDRVVFVLRHGDADPVELPVPEPRRPGLYVPDLTFPRAGEWRVSLRIPVDGDESVVVLPPVSVYNSRAEAQKAPDVEAPEGVTLLKEQQWRVGLKAEPLAKRTIVERVRVPATVTARPGFRAAVLPPVAGRLAGSSLASPGDRVEAGQVLARVLPPIPEQVARLVEAKAEAARAKLAVDQTELSLARVRRLAESGARTEREVQEADFAARNAKAALEAASALQGAYEKSGAASLEGLELRAPISGVVVAVGAALGEQVGTERAVFQILDASSVHLEARIPEARLGRLAAGKADLAELPGARGTFVSLEGKARRVFLGPEVDPTTRTVPLVFEAANPDGRLLIGAALTLHLETARSEDALAVPASALVEEDGRPIAFVQVSGETFEKRLLKLGLQDGGWIQVLEGLAEGERVVVKEAMAVRLASVSSALPAHGHSH